MTLHAKMARPNCENCCFAGENDFWPAISVIQTASSDSKFVNFLNYLHKTECFYNGHIDIVKYPTRLKTIPKRFQNRSKIAPK
jgi:hypothetical protein